LPVLVRFGMYKRSATCWMLGMDHDKEQKQRMAKLAAGLLAHPQMSGPVEALLALIEQETALGKSADETEERVITQIRALGQATLQGWAETASAAARPGQGDAHRHSKKNSGG